jgi:alkylation response protein AidB-like acyl-CoA dehydrogenase
MAEKFISERNLQFLLYEVFDVESLTKYPYYQDHGRETFDMVLETALKMATDLIFPVFQEMDKNPPEFVDGEVKVHPVIKTFMKESGEGGWIAASFPYEYGGQQIPLMIQFACQFILRAANYSATVFPGLTTGAAGLIISFGEQSLIDTYLPKMFSGEWQGTMALTEPDAGSSLADITTMATPTDEGYYKITGQKIFISTGDHDAVDNVIHLMLAKIKGAPAGVRGISLFVVPKKRIGENGALIPNDVNCAGIDHKMGYRGAPICQLSMGDNDDCYGYLVGEPHKGLRYMFQMMNEARIDVGMAATAIASAAYYASLEYSRERPQGRKPMEKDPTKPPVPIIEHADVKRMLLFQRAIVEGSLSLAINLAKFSDLAKVSEGEEEERYELLLDLLTPVVKTYSSEMGILSVSQGLQCLGGYGYCQDFPLEQYYRDMRIHPIHEGTTGIQGMTLLGRNVTIKDGKAYALFIEEVQKTIDEAQGVSELQSYANELQDAVKQLQEVTAHLTGIAAKGEMELFLADATIYLEFFGIINIAWQWLIQAISIQKALGRDLPEGEAHFYRGKFQTFRFFFGYELPKIEGLASRLKNSDGLTVEMTSELFDD